MLNVSKQTIKKEKVLTVTNQNHTISTMSKCHINTLLITLSMSYAWKICNFSDSATQNILVIKHRTQVYNTQHNTYVMLDWFHHFCQSSV